MTNDELNQKELKKKELNEKYDKWWGNFDGNSDTQKLYECILDYELKYFDDMRFKSPGLKKYALATDNYGNKCSLENLYDIYFDLQSNKYTYHIKELDDCKGLCDSEDRSITIDPEYVSNEPLILHEMIHAYENIIDSLNIPFIKEIIFLHLYNNTKSKISDLDDRIAAHANILSGMDILMQGGNHDIFFFLKSLDLDLRCDYKLGTVCGYGRDNE